MTKKCSLAWTGFYNEANGIVKPCCLFQGRISKDDGTPYYLQETPIKEIFNSKYMVDLRNRFVEGENIPECSTCWKDESNGVVSKRERYLKTDEQMETDHQVSFSQVTDVVPTDYQLIISNACNLACKSCSPSHSNMWQAINKKTIGITNYSMPHGQVSNSSSLFWENRDEWLDTVVNLEMVGGEPFFISKWEEVIDELIARKRAPHVRLNFSSNLTIYNEPLLLKMLNNFKSVGVSLSLDGLGKVQEYIRHPASWDTSIDNLRKFNDLLSKEYPAYVTKQICHTVSWYNVLYLPEFLTAINGEFENIFIWINLVHYPSHLSVVNAPQALKDAAMAKLSGGYPEKYTDQVQGLINFMNNPLDPELFGKSLEFAKQQDAHRGLSINDALPEVCEIVGLLI